MLKKKDKNLIPEEQAAEERESGIDRRELLKMCLCYAVLIVAVLVLFTRVFMLCLIPSGSMENTIMTGDIVVATRFNKTDIQRYDIMVFVPPDHPDTYYIKRVIGLPGETITVYDGKIYAGHKLLDDSFVSEEMKRSGDGIYEVPKDCYFMLGDNRNHSLDARYWDDKYVPLENMAAKAQIIIFPFTRAGGLRYDGLTEGNTGADPAASTDGSVGGSHTWIVAEENGSGNLVLCCQECGQQQRLEQLQIDGEPSDGCARHQVTVTELGHIQAGENGAEWVVDSVSLSCKECGWSATAVPVQ